MKPNDFVTNVAHPTFDVALIDRKDGGYKQHSFSTLIEARKFALAHALDFAGMTVGGQIIYTDISITEEGRAVLSFKY